MKIFKQKLIKIILLTMIGSMSFNCEQTDDEEAVATTTTTPTTTTNTILVEEDAVSPAEGTETISASMTSSAETGEVSPGTLAVGLTSSSQCSDEGTTAVSKDDASSNGETGKYAALFVYCNLTHASNGPDTAQGALARVKGLLCALGDQIEYEGDTQDLEIDFAADDCFTDAFAEMVEDQLGKTKFDIEVTGYDTIPSSFAGNSEFDKGIILSIDEIGFYYRVLFDHDADDSTLAVSIRSGKDDDDYESTSAFAIFLDQDDGIIRYEGIFPRDHRHVRAYVEGAYDTDTEEFTDIDNIEFISWEDYDSSPNQGLFQTLKGNPADGYQAVFGQSSSDGQYSIDEYDTSGTNTYCYGDGDCSGNDGLIPSTDDHVDFLRMVVPDDDDFVDPHAWFAAHGPLSFTALEFSAEQD